MPRPQRSDDSNLHGGRCKDKASDRQPRLYQEDFGQRAYQLAKQLQQSGTEINSGTDSIHRSLIVKICLNAHWQFAIGSKYCVIF